MVRTQCTRYSLPGVGVHTYQDITKVHSTQSNIAVDGWVVIAKYLMPTTLIYN